MKIFVVKTDVIHDRIEDKVFSSMDDVKEFCHNLFIEHFCPDPEGELTYVSHLNNKNVTIGFWDHEDRWSTPEFTITEVSE